MILLIFITDIVAIKFYHMRNFTRSVLGFATGYWNSGSSTARSFHAIRMPKIKNAKSAEIFLLP